MTAGRGGRVVSVDFLRGLAMAGMILANNPGDRDHVYGPLRHAAWNGCTGADLVFPMFLFLVGVCVALAVDREALLSGGIKGFWSRTLRRTGILFGLGLLENASLRASLVDLRIPGVLQRIALVYLATRWLHLRLGKRGLVVTVAAILFGYWLVLAFVPVPGVGHPALGPDVNLEGWLDRLVLGNHIWRGSTSWDPEGILSTFPAIALGLVGVLTGRWLRGGGEGIFRVLAIGLAMVLGGLGWAGWFPLNKSLCTSSFVLFVGGLGVLLLAVCHGRMDNRERTAWWAKPFVILGTNALTVYVLASFTASTLRHIRIGGGPQGGQTLQSVLFQAFFSGWPDAFLASAAWGVVFLLAMYLVAWALYARRIVIKA